VRTDLQHAARSAKVPSTAAGGRRILSRLSAPAVVLLLWAGAAAFFNNVVLPGPVPVLIRFAELAGTSLVGHASASLARILIALGAATIVALPFGILLGRVPTVGRLITPTIYLLYPVPKIALLPLIFLLVGVGEAARVLLVWLVLFFQILVAVRDATKAIPDGYRTSVVLLGGGRLAYVRFVLLPAIFPALLTALRIGSGTALAVLFFAETFFTDRGLGFFIVDSWMKSSYVDMTAGIVAIALTGLFLFALLDGLQRIFCRWQTIS
jgi:NitT/TauT family transport system permease protein